MRGRVATVGLPLAFVLASMTAAAARENS